jgi:hypothetical protein
LRKFVLDKATPEDVASKMKTIRKGQGDRHGNDDPETPLAVGQEEADAAFHIALSLTRIFSNGLTPA